MILNFSAAIILARIWWAFVLRGILAIAFGVVVLLVPTIGLVAVVAMFAAWAIIGGATELIGAWRMRGQRHWWVGILEGLAGLLLGVVGVVSVIFGLVLVINPGAGLLSVLWLVGVFAIAIGATFFLIGLRLRRIFERAKQQGEYVERGI